MASAQACCCSSDDCRANGCAIVRATRNVANAVTTEHPAPSQSALIAQLVEALEGILAVCGDTMPDGYVENSIRGEDIELARTALAAARGEG